MIRCDTPTAVAQLCEEVCHDILGMDPRHKAHSAHVALMLGTSAAEASLRHRVQKGGPALGLWQMEPNTAISLFKHYLRYRALSIRRKRRKRWKLFTYAWLRLERVPFFMPSGREIRYHLMNDDPFACALARVQYFTVKEPIPETLSGMAEYWWLHYQTPGGAHDPSWFVDQWYDCHCDHLMEALGYTVEGGDAEPSTG